MTLAILEYAVMRVLQWIDNHINHPLEDKFPPYANVGWYVCQAVGKYACRVCDQLETWDERSDWGWPVFEQEY